MAVIYCFTSTGNSLYAAKRIAEEIGGRVLPMHPPAVCEDSVVGLVFPVYFWGVPRMVARFVSQLRLTHKNPYVFAVLPCGGPVPGPVGSLKKLLRKNEISLSYGKRLTFLSNYLPEFKIRDSEKKRQRTEEKLEHILKKIQKRATNWIPPPTPINTFAYKLFPDQNSDRHFMVSKKCTGCGTCARVCPVNNIVIKGGRPCFAHHCEHCLGCLHNCPTAAIDWKQNTQGKQRYRHFAVGLEELIAFGKQKEK